MRSLRVLVALLVLVAAAVCAPVLGAAPAQAAPWCDDDVPLPATPLTGGGFTSTPPNVVDADPFTDPSVPLSNVYGWHFRMVTYDTGCTPGSSIMPRTGTELANGLQEPVGMMASIGHGLMSAVVNPTWLDPVDEGVEDGVAQVRAGTWFPYLGLVVLVVAVGMLWASRTGRLDSSATAGVWAVLVLGLATYLGSYPLHATQMVDGAVQESALLIATSMSEDPEFVGPPTPGGGPQEAIDRQWDALVRQTTYRTWSEGMLGSATSDTARTYGPDLFKATHLSWTDAEKLEADPGGAGQDILDAKAADFEQVAESIEEADPYAYTHLQGQHWGKRMSTAVSGLVGGVLVMLFLVVAPIGMFIGYIVIRVAVMFSPAAGLIFMFEKLREPAIGLVSKVGRYVVMGPLWLLGALVVLRLNSAILNAPITLWLQLLLCLVVAVVAWSLLRPASGIPGAKGAHRLVRTLATAWAGIRIGGAAKAVGDRAQRGQDDDGGGQEPAGTAGSDRDDLVYTAPDRTTAPALPTPVAGGRERDRVVEWGEMPATQQREQQSSQDALAQGTGQRTALLGRPVAMSGRRARHLSASSSSARPGMLAVGPGAQATEPAAPDGAVSGADHDEPSTHEEAQTDQGTVYDEDGRPGLRAAPLALSPAAGSTGPAEDEHADGTTGQDVGAAPAAGDEGTFAPRRPSQADELTAEETAGAAGTDGVVVAGSQRPPGPGVVRVDEPAASAEGSSSAGRQVLPEGSQPPAGAGVVRVDEPVPASSPAQGDIPSTSSDELGDRAQGASSAGREVPVDARPTEGADPPAGTGGQGRAASERPVDERPARSLDGKVLGPGIDIDREQVHEANVTYDGNGRPVFQVYRPSGSVRRHVDES